LYPPVRLILRRMKLNQTIAALRALQTVDQERIEAEKERRAITERVEQLELILAEMEREQGEKQDKLKEAERWYEERERELKEDNEKIKKAQARLNALTKAREYTAVQREIENLRRGNAQKEEEIRKLHTVIEEFRAAVKEESNKLDKMRAELAEARSSTEARVMELDARIERLKNEYRSYEEAVAPDVLKRYRRIQTAWEGMAVVPVNAKGSCTGCHRQIPPQLYNILLRQDSLETCPYCHRFIYVEEEDETDDV